MKAARTGAALLVGFLLGAWLTLSLQSSGQIATEPGTLARPSTHARGVPTPEPTPRFAAPVVRPEAPRTFLAWTPGGLPAGFRDAVRDVPGIEHSVVVASDVAWMTRSLAADGTVVDGPPGGLAIPVEVAGVDPAEYAPFLPPADRWLVVSLARGRGVMGRMSSQVRGFGDGGRLVFGSNQVSVAAVVADELVGANELMVSRATAARLGVRTDRYALLQPADGISELGLVRRLRAILPAAEPLRVRAPGETPYFRQGDAVLPQVRLKQLFGEFAARPEGGELQTDPAWEATHIATERVPILGEVRCNRGLFARLRGALREVVRDGLAPEIHPNEYGGCYSPRFALHHAGAGLSHHAWGVAIDLDVAENPYGERPTMDPRVVAIFRRWGFAWGGDWLIPDGMHFEFHDSPRA